MAVLKMQFNCGCGFKTDKAEEATKHADTEIHTVHAIGVAIPAKSLKKTYSPKENSVSSPAIDFAELTSSVSGFSFSK